MAAAVDLPNMGRGYKHDTRDIFGLCLRQNHQFYTACYRVREISRASLVTTGVIYQCHSSARIGEYRFVINDLHGRNQEARFTQFLTSLIYFTSQ